MAIKQLNCYCDHCVNNTCSTNQLCYAEWKLVSASPDDDQIQKYLPKQPSPFSSSSSPSALMSFGHSESVTAINTLTTISPLATSLPASSTQQTLVSTASSHQILTTNGVLRLEKTYNCFTKDDPLLIRTVCNETATKTSHVIRRCCHSGDYCNNETNFLPSEEEALEDIRKYLPEPSHQTSSNLLSDFYDQYSSLPLGLQITIVVFALSLLAYIIALVLDAGGPSRGSRQSTNRDPNQPRPARINPFKRILNRLLSRLRPRRSYNQTNTVLDDGQGGQTLSGVATTSKKRFTKKVKRRKTKGTVHHVHPDDRGFRADDEHSTSQQANSVFDTNSMASREPLIKVYTGMQPSNPYTARLEEVHVGPYMSEHQVGPDGRIPASFQMTLGTGVDDQFRQDTSSGSGSGQPYLTQRSISHDIQLCEVVGRGYFGIVWRGEYKGEPVAVKIFGAQAEPSWERESEIYQTTMLRHKNILGFIATDKRQDTTLSGYWLVTDYYPMGSLHDFIYRNSLSMIDAIRMAFSIANGLSHLHIEIFGTRGKPAIAHRDIKTKNILVKNDGTCCIADLGMAVRYNSSTGIVDVPANTRIGTRRYLAPEILENKLNLMDFESVKATDIYAVGLVLWEILRRSCLTQPENDPNAPYDPTQGRSRQSKKPRHLRPPEGTSGSGEVEHEEQPELLHERLVSANASDTRSARVPAESVEMKSVRKSSNSNAPREPLVQAAPSNQQDPPSGPSNRPDPPPGPSNQQDPPPGPLDQQDPPREPSNQQDPPQEPSNQQDPPQGLPNQQDPPQGPSNQHDPEQQPQNPPLGELRADHRPPHHQSFMTEASLESTIDDMTHDLAMMCEPYEPPYFNWVPPDPTAHDMFMVVVARKLRPVMSPRWNKFASMREFATLFTECWYEKPQSRLTALRLRKSLSDIARKYFNLHLEYD